MMIQQRTCFAAIFFLLFFQGISLLAETPTKKVGTSPVSSEQARHSDALGQVSAVSATPVGTYKQLVAAIREVRVESRKRVAQAVAQEKVREAWETGKLIKEHILLHQERATYGKEVIPRLAKDLGTSDTELYRMLEFARLYPIPAFSQELTWSQYRELIYVKDPQEREELIKKVAEKRLSQKDLRREIKKLRLRNGSVQEEKPLTAEPGIPGTYRVVKTPKGVLVLDLGFSDYYASARTARLKEGDIVRLEKEEFEKSPAGTAALYTYQVDVIEVIDGDTLKAVIPLGFGFTTVQKLRLRGLDAPEIESADGQEAKAFLEKLLNAANSVERGADSKTNARVLIRTVKSDKYDRYLADVFVDRRPQTLDQRQKTGDKEPAVGGYIYVNQALLDEGLAVRVEE